MGAIDQAFDSAFASLRERYRSGLATSIAELKKFAVLCEFGEANADIAAIINQLAHRLSGTGETLGFPEISSAATALEHMLGSGTLAGDAPAAAARDLVRACEAATAAHSNPEIPEKIISPDPSVGVTADVEAALPHFVAIQSDPALAKLLADICANRADLIDLPTCAGAIEFLNDGRADLLLLDLDNPGCPPDGIAALHKKARTLQIPILAIASHRRSATVLHALSNGEIECLFKPVEAALLHRKVFEILGRQRLTAIVCDDDPVIREFLKPRFEARGFQVLLAKDGEELLNFAGRVRPSIIVLDRVMPGMDGLEILRMLKAKSATHGIPVLILTSKNQPQEVAEGLRSGAAAYLVKPFAPDQVLAKCLEILGIAKTRTA